MLMERNVAETLGMRFGAKGAHTSRTMMLQELTALLQATAPQAGREELRRLVVEENVLGKDTGANRRIAFKRLSEMYGLDQKVALYRVLVALWSSASSRPLLALLCVVARDPLLRMTTPVILRATPGQLVSKLAFESVLRDQTVNRLNEAMIAKVARYAASTWTQSGHLSGHVKKVRARAAATPHTVALALLLGRVEGRHGAALFDSDWIRLQDSSPQEVRLLAQRASLNGLIRYKSVGDIHEVDFDGLLTPEEVAKLP